MTTLISRNLQEIGSEALATFPAVVIQGARRVGKSTFSDMLTKDRPRRFLTLDDTGTRAAAVADPKAFVSQSPDSTLVIDEIQRLPELILEVKAAIDRANSPGRFVLTGSSNLLRLRRTPDSLAGRAVTLNLGGFSQGELVGAKEDFAGYLFELGTIDSVLSPADFTTEWSREDYAQAIVRGSYPEVQNLSLRMRNLWLRSYVERLTERDAEDVIPSLTASRLQATLRALAANQSGEMVKSRIAEVADLPATTVTRYLDTLETLYLASGVPPWTANLAK
ncbi:MAG: AAA family ATPase, partial [Propionibacteriaceae bacterium]|nr:AAA family ATPase [Propionibacteriaceae bacterium]